MLWRLAICQLVPVRDIPARLGRLTTKGHTIWIWRYDKDNAKLLHYKQSGVDAYIEAQRV